MDSKTVTISELVSGMLSEARRLGMSESTLWRNWEPKANSVAVYYRERGLCIYSSEVTEEYLRLCEQRYEAGELGVFHHTPDPPDCKAYPRILCIRDSPRNREYAAFTLSRLPRE